MKRFFTVMLLCAVTLVSCEDYRARQEQSKKILDSFNIVNNKLKAISDSLRLDTVKLR